MQAEFRRSCSDRKPASAGNCRQVGSDNGISALRKLLCLPCECLRRMKSAEYHAPKFERGRYQS
jgi:hypothetical protein